jgi:5-formyltetrahydrofolate cyclo-ligase
MCAPKAELRAAALARRDGLSAPQRAAASRQIADRVRARAAFQRAGTVLLYCAMRSEVDTSALIDELLAAGRAVVLPVTDWSARRLGLYALQDRAELVPGRFGVPEPPPHRRTEVRAACIDLALIPGVAFDRWGGRLGYGAGLYDGLLPQLPAPCPRWGLAFETQMVDELPCDEHDQRVDAVFTEQQVWPAEGGRDE